MKKLKLYLETSVWNFLFADDAPEKKADTIRFFEGLRTGEYDLFISGLVLKEIGRAQEPLRTTLRDKISEYAPEELEVTGEVNELAEKYLAENFVTRKAYDDLLHAAVATMNHIDFLVSWNLAHIVNARTMMGIDTVNIREGFKSLKICTVMGVNDYEE